MSGLSDEIRRLAGDAAFARALSAAEIPEVSIADGRGYLPQLRQLEFFHLISQVLGQSHFEFLLARSASITEYGRFGEYVTAPGTFGEAIARTSGLMTFHSSFDRLSLREIGDEVAFCYHAAVKNAPGYAHYASLAVMVMQTLARPYLGDKPAVRRIEFDFPRPLRANDFEAHFQCPVLFNRPMLCLVYPRHFLTQGRLVRPGGAVTLADVAREARGPAPRNTIEAVAALVRIGIENGGVSMDAVARQLGLGERTLRRRLEQQGLSFRDVVRKTRISRAQELLIETRLPITKIAMMMGYNDVSNFGRAYRSLTGVSPSQTRDQVH